MEIYYVKKKDEITIHSSVAEYLTYIAVVVDGSDSIEICYEDDELLRGATVKKCLIVQNNGQCKVLRELHLSERKIYHKITNLYATAFNYDRYLLELEEQINKKLDSLYWEDEMEKDIFRITSQLNQLSQQAYKTYLPIVEDLCNREASEEVTHCLDFMLDFAYDKQILGLYKNLCRKYIYTYPESIKYYIDAYKEVWDAE